MNKENCALKLVDEIILYYDARSKKHQDSISVVSKMETLRDRLITQHRLINSTLQRTIPVCNSHQYQYYEN